MTATLTRRGLSLVEMLVAMAISGIVIGVIGVLGAALTLAFVLAVGDDLGDFVDCVEREAQQDDGIIDCEFGSLAG